MKVLAFSALVNALAAAGLGMFVYFRDPAAARNRIYGLYCLSIAFWSMFYCGWQLAESKDLALSLLRLVMAGASLIPILYFHHTVTFLDIAARHDRALKVGYGLAGFFLLADTTPWLVAAVHPAMSFSFWPVPGPFFHPSASGGGDGVATLGFCGRIHPFKGLDVLLDWLAYARDRGFDAQLVGRGEAAEEDGDYVAAIHRQVKRLGLGDRVRFEGRVEGLAAVYAGLDAVVVPSTVPDPLPRSVMEAMSLEEEPSIWISFALSMALLALIMRKG